MWHSYSAYVWKLGRDLCQGNISSSDGVYQYMPTPIAFIFLLLFSFHASAQPGSRLLREPDISSDRIAFIHGGDLWTAARSGGPARRLTSTEESEGAPKFSPNGEWIAFSRGNDLYEIPAAGGEERRLTWYPATNRVVGWTPDGSKLLIHSDRLRGSHTQSPHLFLLPLAGGLPEPLPIPRATHGSFSEDGQSIAYGPNPEIVLWTPFKGYRGGALGFIATYDLKKNRYSELPRTNANDVFPMWHGNAIYFVSDRGGVMNLYRYDRASKHTAQLTNYTEWDVKNPSLGKDAIIYENGGWLYTLDLNSGTTSQVEVTLPEEALPKAEIRRKWQGALDDAWRIYGEHAFRPGAKWLTVKSRYEELVGWATDASDASYVIREMLGEAGQSHITFGFSGDGNRGPGIGLLGADFDVKDGFYRIAKIYRGDESDAKQRGPLAAAGVNAGDFLLSVNGQPLSATREIYAAFEGLTGKETRLMVNSVPSADGAHEVEVVPIGNERALRFAAWVRSNRARVAEATGGRIGYIHIADVDDEGVAAFGNAWQSERDHAEAVIVDVRNCNGGIHPEEIFDVLAAKPTLRMYDWRGRVPPFGTFLDGPKVMIANDQSVSGCDELPLFFKQARVGPLVGTRTFGAIIGAGATYETTGGGRMTVPEYGFYWSVMGWLPENYGVEPDYTVDLKPDGLTGGRDPQLEKAIEVAMTELKTYKKAPDPPQYRPESGVGRP